MRRAAALVLAMWTAAAGAGLLEGEPYAGIELRFDDNLFRFSGRDEALATRGDPQLSDWRSQIRLGAVLQYSLGLQRVVAGAQWQRNRYRHASELDHDAHEAGVEYLWAVGRVADGRLRGRWRDQLDYFEDRDTANPGFRRSLELNALGRLHVTPRWRTELEADAQRVRHSLPESRNFNRDERSLRVGVAYQIRDFSYLGVSLRIGRGDFPERAVDPAGRIAHAFDERGVALAFERVISGVTTLTTELGYTRREHEDAPGLDFGGATGSLRWRRRYSGKLDSELSLFRQIDSVEERDANFRLREGVDWRLRWRFSPLLSARLRGELARLDYRGSPALAAGGQRRRDRSRQLEAGLDWQILWWLKAGIDAAYEARESNRDDRDYVDRRIGVNLEARYD